MPFADIDGAKIHYRMDGDAKAAPILFSNSLGTDLTLWDKQVAALSKAFRLIRYDTRGHGGSTATPGLYSIERLAQDAAKLLDVLKIKRAHFCGLSLGGMTGMWLASQMPERVDKLILANTTPLMAPREAWDTRINTVRQGGMAAITDSVIDRWFTPMFVETHPKDVAPVRAALLATPPEGYVACCAAIRDMDQRASLPMIRAKTLVIGGTDDPATPPVMCQGIAKAIPGARYVEFPAAHLSNIEAADAFNAATREFLLS